ncbi:hypothetical protein HYW84_01295 [Candidatus Peregrinibacteria bacterium]|nr:hypothetical protein [Candidatus Peregrinibacteria bacterium]
MSACRLLSGPGRDLCGQDGDCSAVHTVCLGDICAAGAGAGFNQCSTDAECARGRHLECFRNSCVMRPGAGSNLCGKDADCAKTHGECRFGSCVAMPGPGTGVCDSDIDCRLRSASLHPPDIAIPETKVLYGAASRMFAGLLEPDGTCYGGDCDQSGRMGTRAIAIDSQVTPYNAQTGRSATSGRAPAGKTGPGMLAIMIAGAASGAVAWMRKRRKHMRSSMNRNS